MPFDKFLNKAKNLAKDPKIREKLNSERGEKASDSILDKAAGVAESLTNGKHTDKIQKARDAADRAVGTDDDQGKEQSENDAPTSDEQQSPEQQSPEQRPRGRRPQGED